jgi:hypothetical protein
MAMDLLTHLGCRRGGLAVVGRQKGTSYLIVYYPSIGLDLLLLVVAPACTWLPAPHNPTEAVQSLKAPMNVCTYVSTYVRTMYLEGQSKPLLLGAANFLARTSQWVPTKILSVTGNIDD